MNKLYLQRENYIYNYDICLKASSDISVRSRFHLSLWCGTSMPVSYSADPPKVSSNLAPAGAKPTASECLIPSLSDCEA